MKSIGIPVACLVSLLLAVACTGTAPRNTAPTLAGTAWILTSAMGRPALPEAPVTVNFEAGGRVTGSSGVNRYFADYEQDGDRLHIGLIGGTRRAGPPALMEQESRFLTVLQAAQRIESDGARLLVYGDSFATPLVLVRAP